MKIYMHFHTMENKLKIKQILNKIVKNKIKTMTDIFLGSDGQKVTIK